MVRCRLVRPDGTPAAIFSILLRGLPRAGDELMNYQGPESNPDGGWRVLGVRLPYSFTDTLPATDVVLVVEKLSLP